MAHKSRNTDASQTPESLQEYGITRGSEQVEEDDESVSYLKRTFWVFKYSAFHLAIIAAIQTLLATLLLSVPLTLAPVVVGLVTLAIYGNDRVLDVDDDAIGKPQQSAFVRRHQEKLYLIGSTAYGLAVAISILGGPVALLITLLPGLFWILYATNWLPTLNARFQRLKNVLFVNTALVATAWAVTLTFLPLAFADASITPRVALVFAYFFLAIVICTEVPNVRDIAEDTTIGVRTIPTVYGKTFTRKLLYTVDLLILVLVVFAVMRGILSIELAAALLLGVVYSVYVSRLVGRTDREDLLTVASDARDVFVVAAFVVTSMAL